MVKQGASIGDFYGFATSGRRKYLTAFTLILGSCLKHNTNLGILAQRFIKSSLWALEYYSQTCRKF